MLYIATAIASIGGFLFGIDTGIIAGVMPKLKQIWNLSPGQELGVMVAILAGAVIGAALAGKIADYIGRRDTIMATAGLFVMGSFSSALTNSPEMFVICRVLVGVALGAVSLAAPLYISEISPTGKRAQHVICYQVGITSGLLAAYIASAFFQDVLHGWRGMLLIGAVPGFFLSLASLMLVESPRWLMLQGDEEEARKSFHILGHKNIDATIKEIHKSLAEPTGDLWSQLFTTPVRFALLLGVSLFFFQQFIGINTILFTAPTGKAVNTMFPPGATLNFTLTLGLVNLAMTFVAIFLVKRITRKRILQAGLFGMACCLIVLAVASHWNAFAPWTDQLIAITLLTYIAIFSCTWGPLVWVIISEIYPLKIRGLAMSIPVAAHWLFAIIATSAGVIAVNMLHGSTLYWIFFVMALLGLLFLRGDYFETISSSLEVIQKRLLTRTIPIQKKNFIYYVIATVAATGGLLIGLNIGVISGALVLITPEWNLSALEQGMLVSSVSAGLLIGQLIAGKATDIFGRRYLLLSTAALYVAGSFGCALSESLTELIIGRLLIGLTMGVTAVASSMYLSEIAPSKIRGKLLTLNQLCLCLGLMLSFLAAIYFESSDNGWKYMFGVMAIPAAVYGCCMLFLPESPRWLLSRGSVGACARMMRRMGVEDTKAAMQKLKGEDEAPPNGQWADLIKPWLLKPVLLGLLLMYLSVFTGFDAMIFYAPSIFKGAGFTSNTASFMATFGLGAVNLIMTAVSMGVVDSMGRRSLLLWGMAVMALSLGLAGLCLALTGLLGSWAGWLLIGCLCVFVGAFAVSLGPVTGVIVSEIYPQNIRGITLGIVYAANSLFTFVFALGFPTMLNAIGYPMTFWMFALTGVAGGVLCWKYLPETKGLPLEKIEQYWRKS